METLIVFIFYVVQFTIGTIAYRRWMRRNSQFETAQSQLFASIRTCYEEGILGDYLDKIVDRGSPLLPSRPILKPLLVCGAALFLGVAFMYLLIKIIFPGLHITIKIVITLVSVTPFVIIAFIGIAQEVDDIRILNYAQSVRDRLLTSIEDGTEKTTIEEIIGAGQES